MVWCTEYIRKCIILISKIKIQTPPNDPIKIENVSRGIAQWLTLDYFIQNFGLIPNTVKHTHTHTHTHTPLNRHFSKEDI
jgi:hypothetical protein